MRMRPSQSTSMKRKVGSTCGLVTVRFRPYRSAIGAPVVDARAAQRIDRQLETRAADGVEIEDGTQVAHVCVQEIVPVRGRGAQRLLEGHPLHRGQTVVSNSFARRSMNPVMSAPAGPPCGGLYLKPPSSGGLCDGVTTMPSARPSVRPVVVGEDRVRDGGRRRVVVVPAR